MVKSCENIFQNNIEWSPLYLFGIPLFSSKKVAQKQDDWAPLEPMNVSKIKDLSLQIKKYLMANLNWLHTYYYII
jgi:hypothetical protein